MAAVLKNIDQRPLIVNMYRGQYANHTDNTADVNNVSNRSNVTIIPSNFIITDDLAGSSNKGDTSGPSNILETKDDLFSAEVDGKSNILDSVEKIPQEFRLEAVSLNSIIQKRIDIILNLKVLMEQYIAINKTDVQLTRGLTVEFQPEPEELEIKKIRLKVALEKLINEHAKGFL